MTQFVKNLKYNHVRNKLLNLSLVTYTEKYIIYHFSSLKMNKTPKNLKYEDISDQFFLFLSQESYIISFFKIVLI